MTPNKQSISRIWDWAGLPPAIEPPRGGRVHRLRDDPVRATGLRGTKSEGARWGNQHTANKYCVLCGRETRDAIQVRVHKGSSRNHKCCFACQFEICRKHSRKALIARVRAAVMAKESQ